MGLPDPFVPQKNPAEPALAGSKPYPVGCWLCTVLAGSGCWGTPRCNHSQNLLGEALGGPAWSSPARRLPGLQEQGSAGLAAPVW